MSDDVQRDASRNGRVWTALKSFSFSDFVDVASRGLGPPGALDHQAGLRPFA